MESNTTELIHHLFFLILLIVAAGMIAGVIAYRIKLPDVVLFIGAGMLLGQGLHWINESSNSITNQLILVAGSTIILFDGGRNIKLQGLKKVGWTVALLSVPGVLITVAIAGAAIHLLFGIDWLYALLAAAVIASTDPASIIPVFRQVRIRERVRETVESESAFNDATGSIVTFALLAAATGETVLKVGTITWDFARTAVGGIVLGLIVGFIISFLVAHASIGIFRDYTTIAMMVTALSAYLIGDLIHVSGFMATFVSGLIWGNSSDFGLHMKEKNQEMIHFSDNITVIMRMLIFVLLGSQVDFNLLVNYWWQSLLVVLTLMLIARPATVFASAIPDRKSLWSLREMLFMVWVRETGVIPAALSGMLTGMGVAHSDVIASVTFMAIMLTILLQASTTAWMARKLGVEENHMLHDLTQKSKPNG
ncbi:sodium:proton antiporter [Paenibacillus sp. OV219]|uniref:cation:proton antiporter n=1 Tax=Paenibacillus sp. OV219 TaxID=1884377 RepID=UPI0008BECCC7|nr:sodium:proton antiporter [Paenibacillus sp. OV219]SEP16193.1 cell volume regulation protein A [Paenibacillus sp. OV219]